MLDFHKNKFRAHKIEAPYKENYPPDTYLQKYFALIKGAAIV
jgi:hypothetical protein